MASALWSETALLAAGGSPLMMFWHFGQRIVNGRDGSFASSNCKRVEQLEQITIISFWVAGSQNPEARRRGRSPLFLIFSSSDA
jgi:type IV secretory pathway VirB3-like protein